jgi:predicted acylesterase/phospholipase RssA
MAPPAAPPAVAPLTGPPSPRDLTDDWAICCSGGGIRSATYCLGGLQSLDEGGLLKHAKWILGVSGGSYIAASRALVAHNLGKDDGPRRAYARDTPKSRTCGTTPTTSRPM